MEPAWTGDWAWGLPLIAITLALHALGVVLIAVVLSRFDLRRGLCRPPYQNLLIASLLIGAVGGVLAVLHGIEALAWAAAYMWLGATESAASAMLYSVDSLTTRGASGILLEPHWRMLGALEAANGVLLFGISTAFLFGVVQRAWEILQPAAASRVLERP